MAKADDSVPEPKDGTGDLRTVREKRLDDAKRVKDLGKPDPEAVKADPSVPSVLASGKIEDEMYGVTNPREKLDADRTGAEALAHLRSGPHKPKVTIIDGEPLLTGDK